MSLLELSHVCLRVGHGARERMILNDISFELHPGELIAIWGRRGSGRSTLLQLAAGLRTPSSGVVSFAGRDLTSRDGHDLGGGIGFCRRTRGGSEDIAVTDQLMVSQLARGISHRQARSRTWSALQRVGAERCATSRPTDLDNTEIVRVAIARALILQPTLLIVDEPTRGVDLLERDELLLLLRSLADEGIAVLCCTGDAAALSGSDRALSLSEGGLRGDLAPQLAPVVALRRRVG